MNGQHILAAFCAGVLLVSVRYIAAGETYIEHFMEKSFIGGILFVCLYVLYISTEEPKQ